ncbi:hypothetical protein DSM3645_02543 [Blastopirellula marina DSM 3645]|uniref:Uncharacterized protein n=1 Tax=Blastopirellula marina DSM 3645 TaxID=314230 RepID=A3ZVH2_9BACT|nr:hypothetical protein DSM3645_02543 [Blastopirellula marina DSM 3645]
MTNPFGLDLKHEAIHQITPITKINVKKLAAPSASDEA